MKFSNITCSLLVMAGAAPLVLIPVPNASAHPSRNIDHQRILAHPIGDVKNNYWYDYLSDVREAEHELNKDLRRATDEEDRRDALTEYRTEIADANKDYKQEMREKGYRVGRVTVGD